jgi:RloB-like protein
MARRNPGRSLRRRVAVRQPRKTLLVFCEGERTEPDYLNALKKQPAVREIAAVDLRVETRQGGSVPLILVSLAIEARDRAVNEDSEIDEFWCVFDVEWPRNHPGLREAIERARKNDIKLAISNPCFELWLILHFQNRNSWLDNNDARRLRRDLDGFADKGLDPAKYLPHRKSAADRAAALEKLHQGNRVPFLHDNPSSGMHRLIAAIEPDS